MFVTYEEYEGLTPFDPVPEQEYERLAPIADIVSDHWTLGRIGRASARGEVLPDAVKVLYGAIVKALPAVLDGMAGGERVASFSNGVDSFTFDLATVSGQLDGQLGWLLDMMPVEWVSECVAYDGGPDAR